MENIKSILENAEAILIGAGAGLSTSAGFTYSGPRFQKAGIKLLFVMRNS